MTSENSNFVFIYGTLKRGFPNHDKPLLGEFYCGTCKSLDTYPLVIANKFFSPVLIDEKGSGLNVIGELYKVSNEVLGKLDTLEGVGKAWGYYRINIEVKQKSGSVVSAATYVKRRKDLDTIHSEPFSNYEFDERYVHPSFR